MSDATAPVEVDAATPRVLAVEPHDRTWTPIDDRRAFEADLATLPAG